MRRAAVLGVAFSTLAIAACAAKKEGFDRTAMANQIAETNPIFASRSVEEIEKLKPQASVPFRLAVAQPLGRGDGVWNSTEEAEIASWTEPLRNAGLASEVFILPAVPFTTCSYNNSAPDCMLNGLRGSAARMHADALLLVAFSTEVDEYVNPLSILDLTVVGMWVVPAHHRQALSIAHGVLLDNRSEYLYATIHGDGEASVVRPYAYVENTEASRSARLNALKALGADFIKRAAQIKNY